ncbi:MAG: LuxR C-terminal-related transcriptional regulator [Rubrivivax sp.]|nr:LuxR C-terminal-related transcriptional regulator [Rubrivivax sp.]
MKTARALSDLRDLGRLGLAPETFVPAFLEALHGLVASYRNLFDWTDAQGRLLRYFIEGPVDHRIARLYFEEFHNTREADAMPAFETLPATPAGVRGAKALAQPAFFRTALYQEIWRPQGFHSRIEGVVRGRGGQLLGSLVLYRSADQPVFDSADEQRLAAALPLLAEGLESPVSEAAQDPEQPHVRSPEPTQTLLLTPSGRLCHASPGAMRLLMLADGGLGPESLNRPLSHLGDGVLCAMLTQVRALAALPPGRAPLPRLIHQNAWGRFVLEGHLLQAQSADCEPMVLVHLSRWEPHHVALSRALRSLPLTPGQRAVCRELYLGASHNEVADRLQVAPATVVDHVRKVYRALDLRSTLELRATLDRHIAAV